MSDDKMRAEFEAEAKARHISIQKNASGSYVWGNTCELWRGFQLGYQAGRKAEREAITKDYEEFTKRVLNGEPLPDDDWE